MKKLEMLKNLRMRFLSQVVFFFIQNPFVKNFFNGQIFKGGKLNTKKMCTPGFNCYSCPAAAFSCPIGSIQNFLGGVKHSLSFFVVGFLMVTGALFGRFICGYVCPMGLLQDLVYKIKTPKLKPKFRWARYLKYIILLVFVITLPLVITNSAGMGSPWFCKLICPTGTIFAAVPLLLTNEVLSALIGGLFALKAVIASVVMGVSVFVYRFFCRVLCPLGAIYSFFNPFALMGMRCDKSKCSSCGRCEKACKIGINPVKTPNSPECIRCGECVKSCNNGEDGALSYYIGKHSLGDDIYTKIKQK